MIHDWPRKSFVRIYYWPQKTIIKSLPFSILKKNNSKEGRHLLKKCKWKLENATNDETIWLFCGQLRPFLNRAVFWGSWGNSKNWLEFLIEPLYTNLAS